MAKTAKTNNNPVQFTLFNQWFWSACNTPLCGYSLADGSTNGKVKVTVDSYDGAGGGAGNVELSYKIKGKVYGKATDTGNDVIDDLWDLTGLTNLTSGDYCKVLLTLDTSGNAQIHKSTNASSQADAELPLPPDGECPIGWVETAGSNNWSGETVSTSGSYTEGFDLFR